MNNERCVHIDRARQYVSYGLLTTLLLIASAASANVAKGVITPTSAVNPATSVQTITSAGPLDRIFVGTDGATQISRIGDPSFEVFPPSTTPADYGTFIVVNNALYAPDFAGHGGSASGGIGVYTIFTPISQSPVSGSGTAASPFQVTTVVGVGATGLTATHVDTYVIGQESYRTDVTLANSSGAAIDAILYRAMDCFLGGSDLGYGFVSGSSVGCSVNANNLPAGRIEQLVPLSGGSAYYHAGYSQVWAAIGTHMPFNNTCLCTTLLDNGAGISWNVTVPAGGSITRSNLTVFSPLGAAALFVTKTADQPNAAAGAIDGYTITITNPNPSAATLNSIIDTLPAGFTYQAGTSSGATSANPGIAGQVLTWMGPFSVPANGVLLLRFNVSVSTAGGTYFNQATATGTGQTIAGSGPTAPVTVGGTPPPPPPPVSTVAVPTLGVSMLILLALLTVCAGWYVSRRRA